MTFIIKNDQTLTFRAVFITPIPIDILHVLFQQSAAPVVRFVINTFICASMVYSAIFILEGKDAALPLLCIANRVRVS